MSIQEESDLGRLSGRREAFSFIGVHNYPNIWSLYFTAAGPARIGTLAVAAFPPGSCA
jgi:hypothetical protein